MSLWLSLMDADLLVHFRLVSCPLLKSFQKHTLLSFSSTPSSVHHTSVDFAVSKIGPWLQQGVLLRQPRSLSATGVLETKQHGLSNVFDFPKTCHSRPRSNKYTCCMHKHISYIHTLLGPLPLDMFYEWLLMCVFPCGTL